MDCGRGAPRSARGREFHPPAERGRREVPACQHPLGLGGFRRQRGRHPLVGGLRRRRIPCRHGRSGRTYRNRSGHAPCADPFRVDHRPRHHPAAPLQARHRVVPRTAHRPHRRIRFGPHRRHAGVLRQTARRRAPRAHRRAGRFVHRGRHSDGRPARTHAGNLRRGRPGLRTRGIAAHLLPPHGQDRVQGLDRLQHHAAQEDPREPAPEILRLGLGVPGRTRRLDALGTHRLPPQARRLHLRAHLLPLARQQPRRSDGQRHAAAGIRHPASARWASA